MVDEAVVRDAMEAVQRFVRDGDVSANLTLYQHLQRSLGGEGQWTPKPVLHTLAPCLLQRALEIYQKGHTVDSAILLFVSILNQVMCLRFLPDSLVRPLDKRPTGLQELARFYQNVVFSSVANSSFYLPPPVCRQLITCLGCLLVLLEDDVADTLRRQFTLATMASSSLLGALDAPDAVENAFQIYMAVLDVLSDHRVRIGSIRRTNQRKRIQAQLDMLLAVPAHSENLMCLQAKAVVKGIQFLMYGTLCEPQNIAAAFWQQLPKSSLWCWALCHLKETDEISGITSQQLVSSALRSLSIVDAAAEELLSSSLTNVMNSDPIDVVISCKIVTASMESTMESVVLDHGPDSILFALISSAAEHLLMVLKNPAAPEEAVRAVCEGISVLIQSLTPAHIPSMDPTDDPEDYMQFVESIKRKNFKKMAVTQTLHEYLCSCQRELSSHLFSMTSSCFSCKRGETEKNRTAIAFYALERARTSEKDLGDFQVFFEDTVLAIFTAYERLSCFLGVLPPGATAVMHNTPALAVVAVSSTESIRVICNADPYALIEQAALFPVLSARYINHSKMNTWNLEEVNMFFQRLVHL